MMSSTGACVTRNWVQLHNCNCLLQNCLFVTVLNICPQLSGTAAVQAKNVCLQLVDDHMEFLNHGVVQLFTHPHPPKLLPKDLPLSGLQPLGQADTPQV